MRPKTKRSNFLDRRSFLRGVAASSLGLPLLPSLTQASSDAEYPTRLLIIFSANGTIYPHWKPEGEGRDFRLGRILEPLSDFQNELLIIDGLDHQIRGPGDDHQKGMGHLLTGAPLMSGGDFRGGNGGSVGWGSSISVDQYIAEQIGEQTPFPSLEFGVKSGSANIWSRMSYKGPDRPVTPEQDPTKMFDRLWGNPTDAANAQRMAKLRKLRKSVLDYAADDIKRIESQVSAEDRTRLQAHYDSVRAIERRLDGSDGEMLRCETPHSGDRIDADAESNYPEVGRLQMDLLAAALACGHTRVASLQWSRSVSQIQFSWLGINERHHDLSHEGDNNQSAQEKLTKINRWYAEQLAYLLGKLQSIPEGDGTLLDNTVVVWCNELSKGNSHSRRNIPFVLAGGGNRFFRMGRSVTIDRPHNHLLVSLCHAMGLEDVQTVGVSDHRGGLDELRV